LRAAHRRVSRGWSMYTAEMNVAVFPFSRQEEGEEVVIGRADTGVFLSMPPDAVEILDLLAAGKTVGRAQEIYRAKYGLVAEMDELLSFLETKGIVRPGGAAARAASPRESAAAAEVAEPRRRRYHFSNIPQPVAQALFGPAALTVQGLVAALAALAVFRA